MTIPIATFQGRPLQVTVVEAEVTRIVTVMGERHRSQNEVSCVGGGGGLNFWGK